MNLSLFMFISPGNFPKKGIFANKNINSPSITIPIPININIFPMLPKLSKFIT